VFEVGELDFETVVHFRKRKMASPMIGTGNCSKGLDWESMMVMIRADSFRLKGVEKEKRD